MKTMKTISSILSDLDALAVGDVVKFNINNYHNSEISIDKVEGEIEKIFCM